MIRVRIAADLICHALVQGNEWHFKIGEGLPARCELDRVMYERAGGSGGVITMLFCEEEPDPVLHDMDIMVQPAACSRRNVKAGG